MDDEYFSFPLQNGVTLLITQNGAEGDEVVFTFAGAKGVSVLALEPVDTRLEDDEPYVRITTNIIR